MNNAAMMIRCVKGPEAFEHEDHIDCSSSCTVSVMPFKHVDFDFWHDDRNLVDLEQMSADIAYAFSVILMFDPLRQDLWRNPKYCLNTHHIMVCEAVQDARRRLQNKYYSNEKISRIIKNKGWPETKTNEGTVEQHPAFRSQVMDAIFEAQERMASYFEIRKAMKAAEYEYDESTDTETRIADPIKRKKARMKALREVCMPEISIRYERIVDLPEPFKHWDERNSMQQFFFMIDRNNQMTCAIGAGSSSGKRANHSHYSHLFYHLQKQSKVASTALLRYDQSNILRFDHIFPKEFFGYGGDFSSNYGRSEISGKIPVVRYVTEPGDGMIPPLRKISVCRGGGRYKEDSWEVLEVSGDINKKGGAL